MLPVALNQTLGDSHAETLEHVTVEYETVPGWKTDISKCRKWEELPLAARDYIQRVEDLAGVFIQWIGVGPGRDAIVEKPSRGLC